MRPVDIPHQGATAVTPPPTPSGSRVIEIRKLDKIETTGVSYCSASG